MLTFKPAGSELERLQEAAKLLKQANEQLAAAKTAVEASKAAITKWLKEERKCDLDAQAIGEMINIETVCLIEIGKMTRFDEKAFQLDEPQLHARYKRPTPVQRFKPV